ncbi:MAG TPA: hypothetical protein VJ550_06695 [Geomonas sp.]|nr:hypothetical protein [Geomonas sp.]
MFRRLTVLICLVSFSPAAAGAQELSVLARSSEQAAERPAGEPGKEVNLYPAPDKESPQLVMAANDQQTAAAEEPRQHKTHTGLTLKEFAEVHFGEYRWVYWVGAATGLVLLHVFAFGH